MIRSAFCFPTRPSSTLIRRPTTSVGRGVSPPCQETCRTPPAGSRVRPSLSSSGSWVALALSWLGCSRFRDQVRPPAHPHAQPSARAARRVTTDAIYASVQVGDAGRPSVWGCLAVLGGWLWRSLGWAARVFATRCAPLPIPTPNQARALRAGSPLTQYTRLCRWVTRADHLCGVVSRCLGGGFGALLVGLLTFSRPGAPPCPSPRPTKRACCAQGHH